MNYFERIPNPTGDIQKDFNGDTFTVVRKCCKCDLIKKIDQFKGKSKICIHCTINSCIKCKILKFLHKFIKDINPECKRCMEIKNTEEKTEEPAPDGNSYTADEGSTPSAHEILQEYEKLKEVTQDYYEGINILKRTSKNMESIFTDGLKELKPIYDTLNEYERIKLLDNAKKNLMDIYNKINILQEETTNENE